MPDFVKLTDLLDRYEGFLVDAYGILNDAAGALPGAPALVAALDAHPWLVLTNDSARLPSTIAARLRRFGLPVPDERILSSGMLIAAHVADRAGARTTVLGTAESKLLARGLTLVPPGEDVEIVIVADDDGYDFLPDLERTLNACVRAIDAGRPPYLLLPNPDFFYPRPDGVGLTSGAIAHVIETALARLRPGAPRFVGLGKPFAPIYDEAKRRLPGRLLAIGDQLDTDVAGALAAGLDVAFVPSAVGRWEPGLQPEPTWVIVEG